MKLDIKVPEVGESIREAVLAQWYKRDGERVGKGDILFLIETDKVTLEIVAEADGVLTILVPQGQTVAVGAVVGSLESGGSPGNGQDPADPGGENNSGCGGRTGINQGSAHSRDHPESGGGRIHSDRSATTGKAVAVGAAPDRPAAARRCGHHRHRTRWADYPRRCGPVSGATGGSIGDTSPLSCKQRNRSFQSRRDRFWKHNRVDHPRRSVSRNNRSPASR